MWFVFGWRNIAITLKPPPSTGESFYTAFRDFMNNTIMLRVFSSASEALGCFCLDFGTGMLFAVPGNPGRPYLDWRRIEHGIAPTVLSIALICLAGWLWKRSGGTAQPRYIRQQGLSGRGCCGLCFSGSV